jgi:hypothetical protein
VKIFIKITCWTIKCAYVEGSLEIFKGSNKLPRKVHSKQKLRKDLVVLDEQGQEAYRDPNKLREFIEAEVRNIKCSLEVFTAHLFLSSDDILGRCTIGHGEWRGGTHCVGIACKVIGDGGDGGVHRLLENLNQQSSLNNRMRNALDQPEQHSERQICLKM